MSHPCDSESFVSHEQTLEELCADMWDSDSAPTLPPLDNSYQELEFLSEAPPSSQSCNPAPALPYYSCYDNYQNAWRPSSPALQPLAPPPHTAPAPPPHTAPAFPPAPLPPAPLPHQPPPYSLSIPSCSTTMSSLQQPLPACNRFATHSRVDLAVNVCSGPLEKQENPEQELEFLFEASPSGQSWNPAPAPSYYSCYDNYENAWTLSSPALQPLAPPPHTAPAPPPHTAPAFPPAPLPLAPLPHQPPPYSFSPLSSEYSNSTITPPLQQLSLAAHSQSARQETANAGSRPLGKRGKPKRVRTAFTLHQLNELEAVFKTSSYVSKSERTELSERLGLQDRAIKVWFQNRRMKSKKVLPSEESSFASSDDRTTRTGGSILTDDVQATVPSSLFDSSFASLEAAQTFQRLTEDYTNTHRPRLDQGQHIELGMAMTTFNTACPSVNSEYGTRDVTTDMQIEFNQNQPEMVSINSETLDNLGALVSQCITSEIVDLLQ